MRLGLFVLTEFALSMLVIVEIKMPRGWIFSGMEHDVWSCSFLCTRPVQGKYAVLATLRIALCQVIEDRPLKLWCGKRIENCCLIIYVCM